MIIILIFIVAFSTWIRSLIWFYYKYTVTFTLVKTVIYGHWLKLGYTSRALLENPAKETEGLKNRVRAQRFETQRERRKKDDEEWEKAHGLSQSPSSTDKYRGATYSNAVHGPHDMM